jgi:hypothetical protein
MLGLNSPSSSFSSSSLSEDEDEERSNELFLLCEGCALYAQNLPGVMGALVTAPRRDVTFAVAESTHLLLLTVSTLLLLVPMFLFREIDMNACMCVCVLCVSCVCAMGKIFNFSLFGKSRRISRLVSFPDRTAKSSKKMRKCENGELEWSENSNVVY